MKNLIFLPPAAYLAACDSTNEQSKISSDKFPRIKLKMVTCVWDTVNELHNIHLKYKPWLEILSQLMINNRSTLSNYMCNIPCKTCCGLPEIYVSHKFTMRVI